MHPNYLDIIHQLSTKPVNPNEFDNPNKYLKWFLETLSSMFSEQDELLFTNIQFFDFSVSDCEYFKNGRLTGFPTLYGLNDAESLITIQSEILTFLIAVIINQQMSAGGTRSSINAFQDKMIIESITKDNNNNNGQIVHYNSQQKIISFNMPDLYDPAISKIFLNKINDGLKKSLIKTDSSFLIKTDEAFERIIDKIFSSGKFQEFIPVMGQFLQTERVINISKQCRTELSKLNKLYGFAQDENALKNFITTALLHSWIKSCKYNYMFTSVHYDKQKIPISYAILLAVTNEKINDEKLNLLHVSLNIAFSALTEIQKWFVKDSLGLENKIALKKKAAFDLENKKSSLVYKSSSMQKIDFEITKLARTNEHVLLLGETGVGKDLIASEIHKRSSRADKPFITLPINTLSESLIESELFGHSKGSFTGASEDKVGRFEGASGCTVYLPEISELPEKIQLKLLEFIQFSHIDKVGNKGKKLKVDVRLIFASNADLEEKMKRGKLREDFYYRISVIELRIPPLRERPDDIHALTEHLVKKHSFRLKGEEVKFDKSIIDLLEQQSWKGNVRQLEHLVICALVKSDDSFLTKELFLNLLNKPNGNTILNSSDSCYGNLKSSEAEFKRKYIIKVLKQTNGNVAKAAQIAGITRQALYNICRELNIRI